METESSLFQQQMTGEFFVLLFLLNCRKGIPSQINQGMLHIFNSTNILPVHSQVNITTDVKLQDCSSNSFRVMTISNLADSVFFSNFRKS